MDILIKQDKLPHFISVQYIAKNYLNSLDYQRNFFRVFTQISLYFRKKSKIKIQENFPKMEGNMYVTL